MNKDRKIKEIRRWYNNKVLYNVIAKLKGKEVSFLSKKKATRCIKAHAVKYLLKNMAVYNFTKEPQNIYYSLANLNCMPMFSYAWDKRKKQQKEFNEDFKNYVSSIDIGFDFDNHDKNKKGLKQAYNDTKKVKQLFDQYGVPYEIKSSGSGFHININGKYLIDLQYYNINEQLQLFDKMINQLKIILDLKSLDTSVTDLRRIWKAPYTYDIKSGNIALPLTDEQFENFDEKILKPEYIKNNIKLFKRGNLERNRYKYKALGKFIADYIELE